jgi:hypothetical protein
MRTKCRRLFQDAAEATAAQCTSGNSRSGKPASGPARSPIKTDASSRLSVHYMTIDGVGSQDAARAAAGPGIAGSGSGRGSECTTVSRDTARVSAT